MIRGLRFTDRLKFFIERQFVKGASYQLLILVAIIGLISLAGGLLVLPADGSFEDPGDALWWAFLRLTDTGYLGDDEGTWRRVVSTLLTVSGNVIFLGALIAIMTRWLIAMMTRLERGMTPVSLRHHVVILGWGSRTIPVLGELLNSRGRVARFLERHDARRLRLVVLSESVSVDHMLELRQSPDIGRQQRHIILRSGTALQPEALHRVACLEAAAVIIPGASHHPDSLVSSDVETIKALLSIAAQRLPGRELPYVVAELEDMRRIPVARRAYPGPLQVVAGDATISRLLAQNIIHPGLSELYRELLSTHAGNELYLRPMAGIEAETLGDSIACFPGGIVCGLLRPKGDAWQVHLNPGPATRLQPDDRLVIMARSYDDSQATRPIGASAPAPAPMLPRTALPPATITDRKLLVLGWNRRVPAFISELASYTSISFDVHIVSIVPAARRQHEIEAYSPAASRIRCAHSEADYMMEGELRRLQPERFDSVMLLCSDRLASGEEADARALVGYLVLDEIFSDLPRRPQVILELSDPDNEDLILHRHGEILISPMILSHMLAQVALRPELRLVYDDLFTAEGAEILYREPGDYPVDESTDFRQFEAMAAANGEIALGVYRGIAGAEGRRLELNPPRDRALSLRQGDQLVVLGTY